MLLRVTFMTLKQALKIMQSMIMLDTSNSVVHRSN